MGDLLIRNGTIVDGTGGQRYRAALRVTGAYIGEIARELRARPGDRVIDAEGLIVAPGFIESHTHYDGVMWWQPDLDPLPGYGATTIVIGNCGFGAAPMSYDETARLEMVKIFSFFEDMPIEPFLDSVAWDWRSWPEYKRSVERHVRTPLNVAAYVGHVALRLAVMGMDAWDRSATAVEITQMARLLDEAIAAGALGLSTNLGDHDKSFRPVPPLLADDAEFTALLDVVERHPGATVQLALDVFIHKTAADQVDRFTRLCRGRRIRVQMAGGVPVRTFQAPIRDRLLAQHEAHKLDGRDFWAGYEHTAHTFTLGLWKTLIFGQSDVQPWQEVVDLPTAEEKLALLADPAWRARARDCWDTYLERGNPPLAEPETLLLNNSDNDAGPVGISLKAYADQLGCSVSDALATWFLANGINSMVEIPPMPLDEELLVRMFKDPMTVGNLTDSGAHSQMLCGAGENMHILAHFVRDRGLLTLEEGVHVMTGKLARHFYLADRGELKTGKRADLAIFDPEEIQRRRLRKAYDVPDGKGGHGWRWTRDAAPMRFTIVNGVVIFEAGQPTGAMPGELIGPSEPLRAAAE